MRGKRGSQPGSPATFASSRNRVKSPESTFSASGGIGPSATPENYPYAAAENGAAGKGTAMAGDDKVVAVLVNKVVSKLPCNSGTRLEMVEVDAGVQASVAALTKLARIRLHGVVHALVNALEQLGRYTAVDSLDTVQSQVFLLHILYECLSASWNNHSSASQGRSDPPPLDDNLARYLLATVLAFSHTTPEPIERTSSPAPRSREVSAGSSIARLTSSMSSHTLTKSSSRHSFQDSPKSRDLAGTASISEVPSSTSAASRRMQRYVRKIIAYITASNWSVVVSRVKSRLSHLCTTIEDAPDLTDLRLIEWADLDRTRLSQLLQELSSSFLHVKRHAQVPLASALRQAIWGWIDDHTDQFINLTASNRRLEGGPDILFDHLNSASDISSSSSARRTRAFYPLMVMLLVLCPDLFGRVAAGETGRSSSIGKKASFVDSLRKGLTTSKGVETCASCYVDLVGAASRLGPQFDSSGVWSLVADVQGDLKNVLFYSSTEISDQDVLISGLVGLFRLHADSSIFLKLLSDSDESHRLTALQAARVVAEEGDRLPHYPGSDRLRGDLAVAVRSLIRKQAGMAASEHPELVQALELISVDPAYAYSSSDAENFSAFLCILGSLLVTPAPPAIRTLANQAVVAVLENVAEMPGLARQCGSAVCSVLIDACRQELYDMHALDWDGIAASTDALRTVSLAVLHFAESCPEALLSSPKTLPAISLASQAILTSLMGMDYRAAALSQPSLAAIQKLLALVLMPVMVQLERDAPDSQKLSEIRSRLATLDGMINMPPALGRQHYQRTLRGVVKNLAHPTASALGVWIGLEAVVKMLSARLADADRSGYRRDDTVLDEDETRFWQDTLTGLCAFASIMISTHDSGPSMSAMIGPNLLPTHFESGESIRKRFESFIRDCLGLLASSNIATRETVKDALGADLHIACARVLFEQLHRFATPVLSSTTSTNEYATIFADQATSTMRLMLDRLPAEPNNDQSGLDVSELILMLARYAHRLGRGDAAIRIKAKVCNVLEVALSRHAVPAGSEQQLGNALLDHILEWTDDVKVEQLEQSALKALLPLSEGLVLHGSDDSPTSLRARQFVRIFQHLIHIIEHSGGAEELSVRHPGSISVPPSSADSSSSAITVLANLLAANVDIGLPDCLSLGYHQDASLRTAFMQIMSHTLQHGAQFGNLATKRSVPKNRPFLDAVTGNMALVVAAVEACPSGEVDEISMLLFRAFEARGSLLPFLRILIEREVAMTNHESELFRANSVTTRLLTHFARTYGYNYVRATLQPLIFSLIDKPAETSFELDPMKAGEHEDIERNADHLKLMCQALLDLIYSSTPRVPVMLRTISYYIWEAVEDRYPDSRHSAVGSFIFLRFFCPAIVAPDNIELDIPNEVSKDLRRGLLLITKVIQNLANNVTFGNKEPHMKVLNEFLRGNIKQITKFLSDVAIRPRSHEMVTAVKAAKEEAEKALDADADEAVLHRFVYTHSARIINALGQIPPSFRVPGHRSDKAQLEPAVAAERLQAAKEQVGPPVEVQTLEPYARARVYDDFMKQHAGRSVDTVQSAFYEGPAGQTGRRIFYYIASRVGLSDYDLLAFHIFQVLSDVAEPFDIVFDVTGFSATNELPLPWLKRMLQMAPAQLLSLVQAMAIYNPNTYARIRIRRIVSEMTLVTGPVGKTVVAMCRPNDLQTAIPFVTLDLPDYTMELAYSAVKVYRPVFMISDHEMQLQMGISVGDDCLQLASWRLLEIIPSVPSVKSYIIDVLPYREIDEISGDSDRLIIKHGTETITFISRLDPRTGTSDASRLMLRQLEADLRSARARFRDAPATQRTTRPNDVPGTLLNIALQNLHSPDETLRSAAYTLLQEIGTFFRYETMSNVVKATVGLMVPRTALSFPASISKALATTAPQLTLEFVREWIRGFPPSDVSQQSACLSYLVPWLPNLASFAVPSRDDAAEAVKEVQIIIKGFINLTLAEHSGAHLLLQERLWGNLAGSRGPLMDMILSELLKAATALGFGASRADCIGETITTIACVSVRGKVFTRLRKTLARTYLHTSPTLEENESWSEICVLTRISAMLAYHPQSYLDAQLFLPEIWHSLTLLVGCGPVLMRQTTYGLLVNTLHSLASGPATGEMDGAALSDLLARAQGAEMLKHFGLARAGQELVGAPKEGELATLDAVQALAGFLSDVLDAAGPTMDCGNSWRAKWMGLVASTCFQHNPATQPQAFTVLACMAREEVDDDLIYQLLIAMSSILKQYSDRYTYMAISMIRCLAKIVPALVPDSRYPASLFWVGVGVLQIGHLPLALAGLDLIMSTFAAIASADAGAFRNGFDSTLLEGRLGALDVCAILDQTAGVNFEAELHFSLVSVLWKGSRHSATRQKTVDCLMTLLRTTAEGRGLPYFIALLPILCGSPDELRELFAAAGLQVREHELKHIAGVGIYDLLGLRDSSTALLVLSLVITMLQYASTDLERIILYRFLADASERIPDVVAMTYDNMIPRATSVLGNTTNPVLIGILTSILERAMSHPTYPFPSTDLGTRDSGLSINTRRGHERHYSASISSAANHQASGTSRSEMLLEEMGMKGILDMSFNMGKTERMAQIARLVSDLITAFTR